MNEFALIGSQQTHNITHFWKERELSFSVVQKLTKSDQGARRTSSKGAAIHSKTMRKYSQISTLNNTLRSSSFKERGLMSDWPYFFLANKKRHGFRFDCLGAAQQFLWRWKALILLFTTPQKLSKSVQGARRTRSTKRPYVADFWTHLHGNEWISQGCAHACRIMLGQVDDSAWRAVLPSWRFLT